MALAYYHHHPPRREPNKLRKLAHPPSSFSFVPDDPPPVSNFPYSFPPSRPITVLSFAPTTRPPSSVPTRKLTKARRSVPELSLPYSPTTSTLPMEFEPPKRRKSLSMNFTLNLRRRLSFKKETKKLEPVLTSEPLVAFPLSTSPAKPKIFTLDEPPADIDYGTRPRQRPTLPFTFSDSSHSGSAESASSSKRRWTLATAMTNHDIPDEVFVAEIERIRRETVNFEHGWNWEWGLPDDPDAEYIIDSPTCSDDDGFTYSSHAHAFHFSASTSEMGGHQGVPDQSASANQRVYRAPTDPGHGISDKTWSSALRALLITRDLLRTERNYLASLSALLESSPCNAIMTPGEFGFLSRNVMGESNTQLLYPMAHVAPAPSDYLSASSTKPSLPWPSHPPPPLMHTYLSALVAVSTNFIHRLEADPTIDGAARAFIGCSSGDSISCESLEMDEDIETLERVFVGWCGVVGGWFVEEEDRKEKEKRRRRKLSKTRSSARTSPDSSHGHGQESSLTTPKSASRAEGGFFDTEKERSAKEWRSSSAVSLFKRNTTYSSSSTHSHPDPRDASPDLSGPASTGHYRLRTTIASRSTSLAMAKDRWRKSLPSVPSLFPTSPNSPPLPNNTSRPYSTFDPPSPHLMNRKSVTVSQNLHLSTNFIMTPAYTPNHSDDTPPSSPTPNPSTPTLTSTCTPNMTTNTIPTRGSPAARAMGFGRRAAEREERAVLERLERERLQIATNATTTMTMMKRGRSEQEKTLSVSSHVSEVHTIGNSHGTIKSSSNSNSNSSLVLNGKRVHSVRELAILPVQRVTRYVLLYRDILKHTPAMSPSRVLLERAAETASTIAQKCDRAQENSRFLWSPKA
ncbi:hypothetical protein K435DRAFT_853820 [Dendrothele bispora CBS 962.96]|uniref:DH domain-containing protein n=1 Tax=Dendrothele bispora (strain CBS 962.96) TaxID=1314807 RepID=A0A4S8MG14_DENBC|nr:hypothetical protein K435DRAFT_853820 [Dendrothele bispora CBS 962.96]